LNTGGSFLSDQELRNCILIAVDPGFYRWLENLSKNEAFRSCISITDRLEDEQYHLELISRFLALRTKENSALRRVGDLRDYLTKELVNFASDGAYSRVNEAKAFEWVFENLAATLADDSFRKYDSLKSKFSGGFSISAFEAVAIGISYWYKPEAPVISADWLRSQVMSLWLNQEFRQGSGSGIRASTRIPVTVPLGRAHFDPLT
jgi:hypothetical protein